MPAFIHGFFEGLEGFRSVLGFVALKSALEAFEILGRVGNRNGQIGGIGGVEGKRCGPNRVEGFGLRGTETGVIQLDVGFLRLYDLGDGIRDKAMIGMAIAAVGTPSDDDLRMNLVDEFLDPVGDGVNVLGEGIGDSAKFAVVEVEKDGGLKAKFLASAGGFGATGSGEGFACGNFGEVGGSFFSFGGDGEVDVDAFVGVAREGGSGEDFVVGMGENSQKDARVGRVSLCKQDGAEKQ